MRSSFCQEMTEAPMGFSIRSLNIGTSLDLTYKSHGMGCMIAFTFTLSLVLGGTFLGFAISSPTEFQDFVFATWWTPICGFCGFFAILYFLCFSIVNLFGVTQFVADRNKLIIRRSVWFWSSSRSIERDASLRFEQSKDGGGEEDSFPSWGLRAVGAKKLTLLSRQPLEKSDWLGQLLSEHFGSEFSPASIRE
jgi:hypothetical protein